MTSNSEIKSTLSGDLRVDEPLAPYTSWRVGGPACRYYRPHQPADLAEFLSSLPEHEPLLWIGLGSNLLIRDGGFKGTVIHTLHMQSKISIHPDAQDPNKALLKIDAGLTCAKVARFAAQHGLVGAEFFAGIPGTFGGALSMNAGAFGGDTWSLVQQVVVMDQAGNISSRDINDFAIGYRNVHSKTASSFWFISGTLCLQFGDSKQATHKIRELLRLRNLKQPIGLLSCGSVFRNPPNYYAAELIEASKLKGKSEGKAYVSGKHANFIINSGGAAAKDIEKLINRVKERVFQDHGIELQLEVRIVGERG